MPLKTQTLDEPSINLTSMLDVVLLLVYFFMVGTQFASEERQLDVQLPMVADSTTPLADQPDDLVINVNVEGQIDVNGEAQTLATLEGVLRRARTNFPNQGVVIRGDGSGRYQLVMDVMSVCRRTGIRNISLAYRPPEGP